MMIIFAVSVQAYTSTMVNWSKSVILFNCVLTRSSRIKKIKWYYEREELFMSNSSVILMWISQHQNLPNLEQMNSRSNVYYIVFCGLHLRNKLLRGTVNIFIWNKKVSRLNRYNKRGHCIIFSKYSIMPTSKIFVIGLLLSKSLSSSPLISSSSSVSSSDFLWKEK